MPVRTKTLTDLRKEVDAPGGAAALRELGLALTRRGESRQGIGCLREAVLAAPGDARSHFALGVALGQEDLAEEAEASLRHALTLDGDDHEIARTLGWMYVFLGRAREARPLFQRAIAASPGQLNLHVGLCRALLDDLPPAAVLAQAAREVPDNADPQWLSKALGLALAQVGCYDEARTALAASHGNDPRLLMALGRTESALGDREAFLARYEEAFRRDPRNEETLLKYVQHLFSTKDYDRARQTYRRAVAGETSGQAGAPPARWRGESLAGRTILLTQSGGFGDLLQWSRVGLLCRTLAARVLVETRTPLRRLVETMEGVEAIVPHDEQPPCDVLCESVMALFLLDWNRQTLEAQVPYVRIPMAERETWRARLARGDRFLIGIDWRARHDPHDRDVYTRRSMPLEQLRPLTELPEVAVFSLNASEKGRADLARIAPDFPVSTIDGRRDFADTAAAVAALDLIVTVDTAIVHVAGAQGTPALLMLPFRTDWRWGESGHDCPWYRSCRIYRQPTPGGWTAVVREVVDDIRARLEAQVRTGAH